MNSEKFDLLKSHIDAYTRQDGSVVQAHDDKRQAAAPKTGTAAKAKFVNIGTAKWPMQAKTSEKLKKPHADGSTHHVGGFKHPESGASESGEYPDFSVHHDGKTYNYTGKQGTNAKTGEASYEYSHKSYKDDGDEVTGEHRAWVTKSGHLMND